MTAEAAALVLARRMGRDKAALPWVDGQPLLLWIMHALADAGFVARCVLGAHNAEAWSAVVPWNTRVVNPDPTRGKVSSIRCGVLMTPPTARCLLITAVDEPRPPWVYRALLRLKDTSGASIVAPSAHGRVGHPLVVDGTLRAELMALREEDMGLRYFVARWRSDIRLLRGAEEFAGLNLNTAERYAAARACFADDGRGG